MMLVSVAEEERVLALWCVGWYARHTSLFCASCDSCSKVSHHVGMSCSMLSRSPCSNCTLSASLVSLSPGVLSMCPSHFHLRTLMAATRLNVWVRELASVCTDLPVMRDRQRAFAPFILAWIAVVRDQTSQP